MSLSDKLRSVHKLRGAHSELSLRDLRDVFSVEFLRGVGKDMGAFHLKAYAAALAYGGVFALLPSAALLVLLLGVFSATDLVFKSIEELRLVLPADAVDLIHDQLSAAANTQQKTVFSVGAIIAVLLALWGASGAMRRIMEALNVVHESEDKRSFIRKALTSIALALGALLLVFVSLLVIVVGGDAAARLFAILNLGDDARLVWTWIRWPLLIILLWSGVAALYKIAPYQQKISGFFTPGTVIATVFWLLFTVAFAIYSSSGAVASAWGAAGSVIVLLLYLQYVALIILIGALIDVRLSKRGRIWPLDRS